MDNRYHVRLERPGEGPRLNEVEQAAGELFDGLDHLFDGDVDDNVPLDALEALIAAGTVRVACDADDRPVGFLALVELDGSPSRPFAPCRGTPPTTPGWGSRSPPSSSCRRPFTTSGKPSRDGAFRRPRG